ncbi:MAG: putative toxin-antitoxin system toxin component, PIN family [Thermodesulfobacteriota bacterium]
MPEKTRVFLDTSALFAGIWSSEGGARMILKLGESGILHLLVSKQVLTEIEGVIRRKAPRELGTLALLLERSNIELISEISKDKVTESSKVVNHPGDAKVIASAWSSDVDYFVTLDQVHFLKNRKLRKLLPFHVGTPGDFLSWFKEQLLKEK